MSIVKINLIFIWLFVATSLFGIVVTCHAFIHGSLLMVNMNFLVTLLNLYMIRRILVENRKIKDDEQNKLISILTTE